MSAVPSVTVQDGLDPMAQENEFVHDIYNEIAEHFSQTRYKPWPIVEKFLNSRPKYSLGLDVGCGNGKYLQVNKDLFVIGTDRSEGLIECAQKLSENRYNLGIADSLFLPHPEDRFDFAISIAVIHHFATEKRRVRAISHILSKLKKGGQCLIYCWALEQEKSRRGYKEGDDQDILIPWVLKKPTSRAKKPRAGAAKKRSAQQAPDDEVSRPPAEDKEQEQEQEEQEEEEATKYRYYHLYREGELKSNCLMTGACVVVDDGYEKDNWWVIVEKS
ncbi:uncharacterized protein LODBEIA_P18250 [Lodderomyces beijingensis]|uniref:Methyltransferase type 11 domain-containing protein n=1 Tax=Lodderomyces beijingensis TaxID=1775926 RepID=A0ABP0ZHG4_9ASCO